jgi:uracil-DNA glycosylase
VFLLNAVLTVRQGAANSHAKHGWEEFTDEVISAINKNCSNVVFMLWGAYAQAKAAGVDKNRHLILKACHPSPLSASKGGFFTCGHFSAANEYLVSNGK